MFFTNKKIVKEIEKVVPNFATLPKDTQKIIINSFKKAKEQKNKIPDIDLNIPWNRFINHFTNSNFIVDKSNVEDYIVYVLYSSCASGDGICYAYYNFADMDSSINIFEKIQNHKFLSEDLKKLLKQAFEILSKQNQKQLTEDEIIDLEAEIEQKYDSKFCKFEKLLTKIVEQRSKEY